VIEKCLNLLDRDPSLCRENADGIITCFSAVRSERDVLRLNRDLIVQLTQILGVSADESLGLSKLTESRAPLKNRRLVRQLQNIEKLLKRDHQALLAHDRRVSREGPVAATY